MLTDASFSDPAWRKKLIAVVALALLLRLGWALLIPVIPDSDSNAYDTFARNLATHGVFGWAPDEPFAFWAPGAAFLYAAVYRIAGFSYVNVVAVNLLLSVGLVVFSARVTARFFGVRAALWAAGILAVWPTLVMFTTLLTSEIPYLTLTIAALDLWTRPRGRTLWNTLGAGVLLGAAALVRPMALLLPLVFGMALLFQAGWHRDALRRQVLQGVLATMTLLLVVSPWTWRNYQLYGELVLVSTNGGVTLWMGNVPGSKGAFVQLPESVRHLNDYQRNKVLGAMAKQYIADDPAGFALRTLRKGVLLFSNESIGVHWNVFGIRKSLGDAAMGPLKRFTQASWAVIVLLAAAGIVVGARRYGLWRFLTSVTVALVLYYSVVHAVVIIGDRYHLVMAPQLAALGGLAIAAFMQWRASRQSPSSAQASSVAKTG